MNCFITKHNRKGKKLIEKIFTPQTLYTQTPVSMEKFQFK